MDPHLRPLAQRMADYLRSPSFTELPQDALSEYWRYFHDKIHIAESKDSFSVTGESGHYVPTRAILGRVRRILSNPDRNAILAQRLTERAMKGLGLGRLMANVPAEVAFDAVMTHLPFADIDLSPSRIDFRKVGIKDKAFPSARAVALDYHSASGGVLPNQHTFAAYYLYNILNYFDVFTDDFAFLEIGAGSGNLARLLLTRATRTCYIVDLPRTLCGAVDYLSTTQPQLKVLLPNEAETLSHQSADLVFLTPAQISLVPDHSLHLALNIDSFQEMTPTQVATYYDLADRAIAPRGHFFVYNRVEKIPGGANILHQESRAEPMRFAEYPWRLGRLTRAHEVCRFGRLVQRDNIVLRLERL